MANELNISVNVNLTQTNQQENVSVTATEDQTNQGFQVRQVSLTTTEAAIAFSDLTAEGYMVVENLDATNTIILGKDVSATFEEFLRVPPGSVSLIYLGDSIALEAKTDASTAEGLFKCFDR